MWWNGQTGPGARASQKVPRRSGKGEAVVAKGEVRKGQEGARKRPESGWVPSPAWTAWSPQALHAGGTGAAGSPSPFVHSP